jgi:hypothetical protein
VQNKEASYSCVFMFFFRVFTSVVENYVLVHKKKIVFKKGVEILNNMPKHGFYD